MDTAFYRSRRFGLKYELEGPKMDDKKFISRLNQILSEQGLSLPLLNSENARNADVVSQWAAFLEICLKSGIKLSDERWSRVNIKKQTPVTVLEIDQPVSKPEEPDFKVGLQLLLGMLEQEEQQR